MQNKISIVMAYFNRRKQLLFTLKTINDSKYKNIEVIIVDDASSDEHRLEDIVNNYNFPIKLIRIDPKDKKHANSCVPYNMGFKYATGDMIIIQNPEVCHIGDVVSYVNNNLKDGEYLSFSCANLQNENSNEVLYILYDPNKLTKIYAFIEDLYMLVSSGKISNYTVWYNHHIHRPADYHFLTAINKKALDELGGFNQEYANAAGYDDNEFIFRVRQKLNVKRIDYINNPFGIHQWHTKLPENCEPNRLLYEQFIKNNLKKY